MAQQNPITFVEVLNLVNPPISVPAENVKFGTCSMESDKYVTVCENVGGVQQIAIIDMTAGNAVTRQKISAEAAIMNPNQKIIALRAGQTIQIFNLDARQKLKSFNLTNPVSFWRWISPTMIAMVTATSVFHWSSEGESNPVKIFDRNPGIGETTQIINYQVSGDEKWCLLCGISAGATPGTIDGTMQLYSTDKSVSQMLQGHSGVFTVLKLPGRDPAQILAFEDKKPDQPAKLFVMEVGRDKSAPGGVFRITPQNIPVPADAANDFPVTMNVSKKHDTLYMISKMGYLYLFDIFTGKAIYRARITQDTVFSACEHSATGGILGVTRRGQILHVGLNESALVPYIMGTLRDQDLAISLASRLGLAGADDLYVQQFNTLIANGDIAGAAKIAAESPRGFLRTPATIQKFQSVPAQQGQPQPVFQYFSVLLERGKLNHLESVELAKPVLQQNRPQLLEKWIAEDKLEASEELGDLVVQMDVNMALGIYQKANCTEKVINCFMQKSEFDKIPQYAAARNYRVDYAYTLQQLVRSNPQGALDFAKKLVSPESGPQLIDINSALETFLSQNLLREATAFLLEALKGNKKEEGFLQTRLLEINLLGGMPQVADAIMGNEMFSHYDKAHIARLCEQAGLIQRALEHYSDIADIKRCLHHAPSLNPEFLVTYFGTISREGSLDCLKEMLKTNIRQNLNVVVQIATKYSDPLGPENLIKLFEDFKSFEGLFYYLGGVVNFSQSPLVHKKYIESAARMQQFKEVERVCRDSTVYDPQEVKQFLMEAKLPDPRPLIHVCDRFDFVDEMTEYLYRNNLQKYIEVYVTKVSPQKTPQVVGKLLDLEEKEDLIRALLNAVGQLCPVAELVEQVERRNRLRLLHPFLEARIAQGNTEAATHNAIGKIYVTLNKDPLQFLQNNQFYDPKVLGAFCERSDPHLAFEAYKHARGECDNELIKVAQENGLFKDLARYLVERQDIELWTRVLKPEGFNVGDPEPPSRRYLLDQVVQTALPETKNADEVSSTVKAFMACDLPGELIELLERLILQGSDFSNNRNLQNLLILTAIRANKEKVMDYINRLDNFDGPDIAKIAASEQHELFEEAFTIYTKFGKKSTGEEQISHHVAAVTVLVENIHDLDRAKEFAERVNAKQVWSKLAKAQLDAQMVTEAIHSYIKAKDASDYTAVIYAAESSDNYEELIPYLKMARKDIKETILDTQLIYALAKCNKLADLEELISVPNVAKIDQIGERCFDEGLYEAAKLLFININNNSKLALCYVALEQYREAVDAATKANSVMTWKEVNRACLKASEIRLANVCGLHIITYPDHLEELILFYERLGRSTELIQLMEQGLGLDNAHAGVFTELGILYSKYLPAKLMEHIKIFFTRMNIPKLLRACEKALLWDETVHLYKEDQQHDAAVRTMIEHQIAFKHELFLDCVVKVRNPEVQYKAIYFYITSHPMQLARLLQVLTPHLDHARVVHLLRKHDALVLSMEYMKHIQKENLSVVNEALNEILIDEEDYAGLRASIDDYDNFDQIFLAQKVEKHELLEFRRIAAYLYKRNKRWNQSVQLSKEDRMYKDAIDTAAESNDAEIAEELLRFFVSVKDTACFAACLHTCYDLIKPDVVLELSWRNGYNDFSMPYMIQYMRHSHERIKVLEERTAPPKVDKAAEEAAQAAAGLYGGAYMGETLMIANSAYGMNGYGGGPQVGPGGIPDPYSQPGYAPYGAPPANGYGGYGTGYY